jgi:hypothetical protein
VRICSEGLSKFAHDRNVTFHSLRFKSAIKAGIDTYLVEDFIAIWENLKSEKARRKLLQDLLSIFDPEFSPALLKISETMKLSDNIRIYP